MKHTAGHQPPNIEELERRVLDAARKEQPSAALSARMASGIGLSAAGLARAGLENAPAPQTAPLGQELALAASKGTTIWGTWVPWVSGVVVVAVGAVVATNRLTAPAIPVDLPRTMPSEPVADVRVEHVALVSSAVVPLELAPSTPTLGAEVAPSRVEPRKAALRTEQQNVPEGRPGSGTSSDLRAEIALVDAARAAVQSGAHERALGLLSDYDARHPNGSFRPEVTVLRIEALAKTGRSAEASRLAQRFIAKHRGSPLAERVEKYQ